MSILARRSLPAVVFLVALGTGCATVADPHGGPPAEGAPPDPALTASTPDAPERTGSAQEAVTCDVLSGFGAQSSVCALRCIVAGHHGGYCDAEEVCRCRD
jgi:hypothetical protein